MRISHETIYRWVYLDASQGGDFQPYATTASKTAQTKRYGSGRRLSRRVSIEQRPAVVKAASA